MKINVTDNFNSLKDVRKNLYMEIRHLEYQIALIDSWLAYLKAKENLSTFESDLESTK